MEFAAPWGLLAGLSIPTILAIHMFRRRYQEKPIAGVFLWAEIAPTASVGRRRDRPPITRSLLLELLAAAILTLLIAEPLFPTEDVVEHLVFVLDNSASMSAKDADDTSARDRAIARVEEVVEDVPRCVVTVITTGRQPEVLAGPAASPRETEQALRNYRPLLERHDFSAALLLATQVAGKGKVIFLTDGIDADRPVLPQVAVEALGRPLANVGITSASYIVPPMEPEGARIFLHISNLSDQELHRTLTLRAEGAVIHREKIELARRSRKVLTVPVTGSFEIIEATIDEDAMGVDNRVTLIRPKAALVRITNLLPPGRSRRTVERALRATRVTEAADPATADLVFALPGAHSATHESQWVVEFGGDAKGVDLIGPYMIERANPLAEGIQLDGVVWGGVSQEKTTARPIISAGEFPLFTVAKEAQGLRLRLNIDMQRSNLHKSPAGPLLISNIVERRREQLPQLLRWNLHQGERFSLLPPADTGGRLIGPSGDASRLGAGRPILLTAPAQTGVYTIQFVETDFDQFAVNFLDATESDLSRCSEGAEDAPDTSLYGQVQASYAKPMIEAIAALVVLSVLLYNWYHLVGRRHDV